MGEGESGEVRRGGEEKVKEKREVGVGRRRRRRKEIARKQVYLGW